MNTPFIRVLLVGLLALLAACGVVPKKSSISIYDPQPVSKPDPAWPHVATQLVVQRPTAARMIDSSRIVVRPEPGELQVYRGANWVQPAPDMLQDAIVRGLADSGKLTGVSRRGSGIASDYDLTMDIRRFDADYTGTGQPQAVLEVSANLIRNNRNQIIGHQVFRASIPANGVEAGEISQAFQQALAQVSREISGWSLQTLRAQR